MEVDSSLAEEVELHCLGGFVMTSLYDLQRPTAEVDILPIAPNVAATLISIAGQGSPIHRRHKVYIQVVGVAPVPNYQERLVEIFPGAFNHFRLLGPDPIRIECCERFRAM